MKLFFLFNVICMLVLISANSNAQLKSTVKDTIAINANKFTTKPNKDSLKKVQRAAWLAKQDSIKNTKSIDVKKVLIATTVQPNKDSLKKVQRAAWLAKQDSIKLAKTKKNTVIKNNNLELKKDTILKINTIIDSFKVTGKAEVATIEYIPKYGVDDIIIAFSNNKFNKVIDYSEDYLSKNPDDTNIILKRGLSLVFNKQQSGFKLIDSIIGSKDSIIQYYSILPYVNNYANKPAVYQKIIDHINEIDSSNIWALYANSTHYKNLDNMPMAIYYAQKLSANITTMQQANSLGYFYPLLLHINGNTDSAITVLNQVRNTYPNLHSINTNLFVMYKEKEDWNNAYKIINELTLRNASDEDLFNEKLDICFKLKMLDEACNMIKENNEDYKYDDKIIVAQCKGEFYNWNIAHQTSYVYNVNQKGHTFNLAINLDAALENKVKINYINEGQANNTAYYIVTAGLLDTSRNITTTFFNSNKPKDSTKANALWVSKLVYNDVVINGLTYVDLGNGLKHFRLVGNIDNIEPDENIFAARVEINGIEKKLLNTWHLIDDDGVEQIWILKNNNNPIIVKAITLNNEIELKQINIK